MKKIFHFLGSIYLAFILIAAAAAMVIIGTFIESKTGSHRFAAYLTYHNPFFHLLLWGFFLNILISALRRWPFKYRHIPFLITHFGLLMILSGVILKNLYGKQGSMSLLEGSGSQTIVELEKPALHIEGKTLSPQIFKLDRFLQTADGLQVELLEYAPHVESKLTPWVSGDQARLSGLPPLQIKEWKKGETLNPAMLARLHVEDLQAWEIYTYQTDMMQHLVEQLFQHQVSVRIRNRLTKELVNAQVQTAVDLQNKQVNVAFETDKKRKFSVDLVTGPRPEGLYQIEFSRKHPALAVVTNSAKEVTLLALNAHNQLFMKKIEQPLDSIVVYDNGYAGYTSQAEIIFQALFDEELQKHTFVEQLRQAISEKQGLAPPLACLQAACEAANTDFPQTVADFLFLWESTEGWLFPEELAMPPQLTASFHHLSIEGEALKGCYWATQLLKDLDQNNIKKALKERQWPLLNDLVDGEDLLTQVTKQVLTASSSLPQIPQGELTPSQRAQIFSAYLRAYSIHLHSLNLPAPEAVHTTFTIETPLSVTLQKKTPSSKWEDNVPMVVFKLSKNGQSQILPLAYDANAAGLKWPALHGSYLLRFQPHEQELPYRVRLRQARQLNYPHSSQPYSYESDLLITDLRTQTSEEKTISMNRVHETWDGYRFYLANVTNKTDEAKRIQLIINHDPAKYWMTYPGAFILTAGIFLLFWMRPYKK